MASTIAFSVSGSRSSERGTSTRRTPSLEKVEEYEARIAALERTVGQLTMEIDLLKKLRERTSPPDETPSVISGPAVSPLPKDDKS
jgi:transposase